MFKAALVHIDDPNPRVPDWVRERLEAQGVCFVFQQCACDAELIEVAANADVVWVYGGSRVVTPLSLPDLKCCRAIIRTGSGTDNIPVEEASALGILVVNTPQVTADSVSDHAIALLLSVHRWIPRQDRAMRQGQWRDANLEWNWRLSGSMIGFVGFGRIAQAMVRKLIGFDLHFVACDPHVPAQAMADLRVLKAELNEVLSQADVISLHTPLTKETHHLIADREFRLMKPNAILINTSRGGGVDEQALVKALSEGHIAAAGLDVFENSPPSPDSPLRKLENVVITPHTAAERDRIYEDFWQSSVEAICDMAQGHLPASCVNPHIADGSGFTNPGP